MTASDWGDPETMKRLYEDLRKAVADVEVYDESVREACRKLMAKHPSLYASAVGGGKMVFMSKEMAEDYLRQIRETIGVPESSTSYVVDSTHYMESNDTEAVPHICPCRCKKCKPSKKGCWRPHMNCVGKLS